MKIRGLWLILAAVVTAFTATQAPPVVMERVPFEHQVDHPDPTPEPTIMVYTQSSPSVLPTPPHSPPPTPEPYGDCLQTMTGLGYQCEVWSGERWDYICRRGDSSPMCVVDNGSTCEWYQCELYE